MFNKSFGKNLVNSVPMLRPSLLAHLTLLLVLVKHLNNIIKVSNKVDEVDCLFVNLHPVVMLLRIQANGGLQVRLGLVTWGRNRKIF
jgi:hypothetical protein